MNIIRFPSQKLNKKRLILLIVLCVIFFIILITSILYFVNASFRAFIDIHLFRKEIKSNSLASIEINSDEDQFFYAYDKYITVLNKNILYTYTSSGQLSSQNDVTISSPIFASNNKFLAIAENNGNSIYLVSGDNILWQTTVDGNLSKINVNKNGYLSAIVSGTSYKSIVISFDTKGNELFKTYLSDNIAIDTAISTDNKYLSIAEIDYSGSIIKSSVKNISIEKAKTDPTNSVIYTYNAKENTLLTDINYQDKNLLICMFNDSIHSLNISDLVDTELLSFNDDYEFIDINSKNNFVYTTNQNIGFSNTSKVFIHHTQNASTNSYEFKGNIKALYVYNEKMAINTGTEIHCVGLNGWLIKKYSSTSEINHLLLGDTIMGIVHKDKIEIVDI